MFFDGVECLSFEINDIEEDSIAALETRLNAVAPHATKVSFIPCMYSILKVTCVPPCYTIFTLIFCKL